jgi:class 3 adenylate cyclase/TolB-like protein/Flp pilus assembly protein TadD
MERRLAAILAIDVVGYSRLMEQDEADTFERLRTHRKELFEPKIAEHRGRIFKLMGDGLLVEFASIVDAVECAIALQRGMADRNSGLAADRRVDARMGINLGDVIVEDGDRHGDGVNIASQLQGLADPGGITISGTAYDQVKTKVAVGYAAIGEQSLKNIAEPVRVYRLLLHAAASKTIAARKTGRPQSLWLASGAVAAGLAALGTGVALWFLTQEAPCLTRTLQPMTAGPSIAVLPFDNLSGDMRQMPIVDGMADDLTTALSQIHDLLVIARNSSFAYRGKSCDVRRIAKELGVRNLIQGGVQRAADTMRVNVQIIDGATGGHIWARTFDGSFSDHLMLQDKIAQSIADALSLRLDASGEQMAAAGETHVPAAYEAFLRGWGNYRRLTKQDLKEAVPNFEEAIRFDQNYSRAYAALAMVYVRSVTWRWTNVLGVSETEAISKATEYLALANEHPTTLSRQVTGVLSTFNGDRARALSEFDAAIVRDPGDPWSYAYKGWVLTLDGRYDEAMLSIDEAIRRDPHAPMYFFFLRGSAAFGLDRLDEAEQLLATVGRLNSDDQWAQLLLAPTYFRLGRTQDAWAALARFNKLSVGLGDFPVSVNLVQSGLGNGKLGYRIANVLREANIPEHTTAWLSGNQLKQLLFGHRVRGPGNSGETYEASFSSDGSATMSGTWGSESDGRARIEGRAFGQVCIDWPSKPNSCAMVFSTYNGMRALKNEFTWVDTNGAFVFSQVD